MTQKTQSIHAEAGLHRKLVLFAVQLEIYLAHFPNCHKYTLTQGIRQAYLDVYNLVTECQKRYHKKTTLTLLDVRHEQLRMMLNLAYELGLFGYSGGRNSICLVASIDWIRKHHLNGLTRPNSCNGVIPGWFRTHVAQKIDKRNIPPVTHSNSPASIVLVAGCIFVIASLAHSAPSVVFGRFS